MTQIVLFTQLEYFADNLAYTSLTLGLEENTPFLEKLLRCYENMNRTEVVLILKVC